MERSNTNKKRGEERRKLKVDPRITIRTTIDSLVPYGLAPATMIAGSSLKSEDELMAYLKTTKQFDKYIAARTSGKSTS